MIRQLFEGMGLTSSSLSVVAQELRIGDTVKACNLLLDYYKSIKRQWVIQAMDPLDESTATEIVRVFNHDSILIHDVADHFPVRPSGGYKWDHLEPDQDAEFAYSLNAQSYNFPRFILILDTQVKVCIVSLSNPVRIQSALMVHWITPTNSL